MNAAYFMIEEIKNLVKIEVIKTELINQNVRRLLDYYLGIYKLEEGEILEPWDLDELDKAAKQIAFERFCNNNDTENYGDCNEGDCNEGDCNEGDCNNGDCNNGDCNNGEQIYLYYGYEEEPIEIVIV